jgi:hypothetical protein
MAQAMCRTNADFARYFNLCCALCRWADWGKCFKKRKSSWFWEMVFECAGTIFAPFSQAPFSVGTIFG